MCLDRLKDFKVKLDENEVGIGWKVFGVGQYGGLYTELRGNSLKVLRRGCWLKEKTYREHKREFTEGGYSVGFHVFLTKKGACNWGESEERTRKVKFRKVVATGIQKNHRTIVAKEIFIPK